MGRFPFGAPVLPRGTEVPDRAYPVLVLGAYPSALHVRWSPPAGYGRPVTALPVDNEPTPFWDGDSAETQALFEHWCHQWFDPKWGENDIVTEALREEADRLTAQVQAADPELVVTLGNAAARVLATLGEQPDREAVLRADTYGQERQVTIASRTIPWQALVHPATTKAWAERHVAWQGTR
jgi:hypothetical protein